MKRLLVLFIVLVTVLSLFALPISADEVNTPNSEQNIEETEENKNFFEKIIDFLKGIEVSVGPLSCLFSVGNSRALFSYSKFIFRVAWLLRISKESKPKKIGH